MSGVRTQRRRRTAGDAQWFKDAILYELHVRSFQDSTGDGIGDFRGLTSRLPYLRDLGVTALWLLPFYPSPLRDDGYDIADYFGIHPDYGTLDDFRRFLEAAHAAGLHVITELVVNHTSDQHSWFQRARRAPAGSEERKFYVWSDSPDRYGDARVIFQDFETSNWSWDPVARAYYWHRFYAHQPDLNYDNPAVFDAVVKVLDHWFGMGVDGLRLDAVPYLIEREGTHSENLQPTHEIIKRLRAHVDQRFPNRIFIAEANQWPEDAAAYFGSGDESHMIFHFPLMPRLFMALRQEDRLPITDILAQTPDPPEGCQWALFLRNHDELTLEMVTDEERLYMYQVYASDAHARINLGIRRRLAPLLGNDRRRIELMNALLFSLQGTPVLYYGDEIGMGDNIYLGDRNGVRTPMQWSGERNGGFSTAPPQRLFLPLIVDDEYHHQSVHVARHLANPHSLLWWMRRLIALRKRFQAFGRGTLAMIDCPNPGVLAFVRAWERECVLVVANLSRFVQHAELDLRQFRGRTPVEVFGRTRLPVIDGDTYSLTLHPHGFLWLDLSEQPGERSRHALPLLELADSCDELFTARRRSDLERVLPEYVERCTAWNVGGRSVISTSVETTMPIGEGEGRRWLSVIRASFTSGEPERYLLPLGCRPVNGRRRRHTDTIARLSLAGRRRAAFELFDAAEDPVLASALAKVHRTTGAEIDGIEIVQGEAPPPRPEFRARALRRVRRGSNPVFAVGNASVLKLFRRIEEGPNPEIEIRRHLHAAGFRSVPALLAAFRAPIGQGGRNAWLGVLQERVPDQGEAWSHAVAAAERFLAAAPGRPEGTRRVDTIVPLRPWDSALDAAAPALEADYAAVVQKIGARTADLHRALAAEVGHSAFAVEPESALTRRSTYQRMRTLAVSVLDRLERRLPRLEPALREIAAPVLDLRGNALSLFRGLLERRFLAPRIRCHGNLHLGQILHAGDDFVFIDFDGEPGRPIYERRLKRSPLQDLATLVRSFHYAAHTAMRHLAQRERGRHGDEAARLGWMRAWQLHTGALLVDAYSRGMEGSALLPADPAEARLLFHMHVVERALYELGFELSTGMAGIVSPLMDLPILLPIHGQAQT